MIEWVTFDLDDTLWAVKPVILQAEADTQAWLASEVPDYPDRIDRSVTLALRDELLASDATLRYDISELRRQLLEQSLRRCDLNPTKARELAAAAFEVFMIGRNKVEFFPGALNTLQTLTNNYRLAALTNGNADIERIGLHQHMEFSISPREAQARKPHPAIFAATLQRANCDPHQVVHVGDHPEEDVGGAVAAGWRSIWVNHNGASTETAPNCDAIITHLDELPAAIAGLSA